MRYLNRNKKIIYYDEPTGNDTAQVDANGYKTGEYVKNYTTPTQLFVTVTEDVKVEIVSEKVGRVLNYERDILGSGSCPFGEDARLYIEHTTSQGHDYIVGGIQKSINGYKVTCKKVVG